MKNISSCLRFLTILFGITLTITACDAQLIIPLQAPVNETVDITITRQPPEATPIEETLIESTKLPVEQKAYLLVESSEPPARRRLISVSANCLLYLIECSPPEVLPAFPEEGVTIQKIHWSSGGQDALVFDMFEPSLLRFDPFNVSLTTIAEVMPAPRDDITWLSNDQAVFILQGVEDYTTKLVLFDRTSGIPHITTWVDFEGTAVLLGLDTQGRVLVSEDIYGFRDGEPSLKEGVIDVNLLAIDPVTREVTELMDEMDWLFHRPEVLLPDGRHLIHRSDHMGEGADPVSMVDIFDLSDTVVLGQYAFFPAGSPDLHWLAYFDPDYAAGFIDVRLMDLHTGETSTLTELTKYGRLRLEWSPDSRHLIIAKWELDVSTGDPLLVANIEGGTVVTHPLDLGDFPIVEDISWGP